MNVLARIIFHMNPGNADALRLAVHRHVKMTVFADGQIELRNLIAGGKIRVEVVLTGKDGAAMHFAVGGKAHQRGIMHGLTINDRQSTGHARADFAHIAVGRLPETRRAGTEQFGSGGKLHMHFQADNGFISGHSLVLRFAYLQVVL